MHFCCLQFIISGMPSECLNILEPDQARCCVRPVLSPNSLQRISADSKSCAGKQKVCEYDQEITKYHNYTLQTNPMHLKKEPQNINSNKTPGRQSEQSHQLSLSCQDDCKTRKDIK